jgi:hypothetical protein
MPAVLDAMKKSLKLKDIEVEEISLVDSAATFKKFFITKRSKSMKKFLEILKSFFGDELKEEDITKAKEIEEDTQETIGDALTLFDEYHDDFPPDALDALKTVVKMAITPAEKVKEPDFVAELTNLEKAGARLSKATIAQLKKIGEIVAAMVGAAEKALGKSTDDEDELSPEMLEKLEKLKAYEDAEAELKKQKAEDYKKDTDKKIEDLEKKIEKIEKKKPVKKGLEGQESDDDDDDDDDDNDKKEFQWKSLTSSEEED